MSATMEHQHMLNTSKYKYEAKGWLWLRHIHIVCHVMIRTSAAILFLSNHNDMWRAFHDTSRLQRLLALVPLRLQWTCIHWSVGPWHRPSKPKSRIYQFWSSHLGGLLVAIDFNDWFVLTHGGLQPVTVIEVSEPDPLVQNGWEITKIYVIL